jgi:hypothetical protein
MLGCDICTSFVTHKQVHCPNLCSLQVSMVLGWVPGVSVAVLENVVAIPHDLALLCVTPLHIFAFFCFTGNNYDSNVRLPNTAFS